MSARERAEVRQAQRDQRQLAREQARAQRIAARGQPWLERVLSAVLGDVVPALPRWLLPALIALAVLGLVALAWWKLA